MKNKEIIKGELGNISDYPVFKFLINGELKRLVLFDDAQKILTKALSCQRADFRRVVEGKKVDKNFSGDWKNGYFKCQSDILKDIEDYED